MSLQYECYDPVEDAESADANIETWIITDRVKFQMLLLVLLLSMCRNCDISAILGGVVTSASR